ncbi:hypothetical protein [Burkholderia vietnamiensis]|uniref:hypothetical protein n=1 Tax=Burkholderia vietnamiensis TaxID=60552 RepID=UPI0007540836|nr:hypothetical protein [Burkholderia vietnamiensis]KVE63539.1 hypothetical protein WI97_18500 [Burkholderia vietnamiensis]
MRTKKSTTKSTDTLQLALDCMIADAMDQGLMQVLGEMTPRQYVALRTMSPFEIGQRFQQLLRDELYERPRRAMKGQKNGSS